MRDKNKISNAFKSIIKELRTEKRLSQDEFAKEIGISKGAVSYYEKGDRVPDIVTLSAFADYFGVSTDYLLGRTNVKNPAGWSAEKEELMAELTKCRNMVWTISNELWNLSHKALSVFPNEKEKPDENT